MKEIEGLYIPKDISDAFEQGKLWEKCHHKCKTTVKKRFEYRKYDKQKLTTGLMKKIQSLRIHVEEHPLKSDEVGWNLAIDKFEEILKQ